jgi:hypothetical protein
MCFVAGLRWAVRAGDARSASRRRSMALKDMVEVRCQTPISVKGEKVPTLQHCSNEHVRRFTLGRELRDAHIADVLAVHLERQRPVGR